MASRTFYSHESYDNLRCAIVAQAYHDLVMVYWHLMKETKPDIIEKYNIEKEDLLRFFLSDRIKAFVDIDGLYLVKKALERAKISKDKPNFFYEIELIHRIDNGYSNNVYRKKGDKNGKQIHSEKSVKLNRARTF